MKKYAIFLVMSLFLTSLSSWAGNLLQRAQGSRQGSACYIARDYVGFAWNDELVEARYSLRYTQRIPDFPTLLQKIELAKATSSVVFQPGTYSSRSLSGDVAFSADQAAVLLLGETALSVELSDFMDLNCSID